MKNRLIIYDTSNFIEAKLRVNSEWLKGVSKGKDVWQFAGKDLNGNGLMVHCSVNRNSILMRNVAKGSLVNVKGSFYINKENAGDRLNIDVESMEVINE